MSSSSAIPYRIPSVVPGKEDFLFIRPGGRWHKVRQQSAWNRERLSSLAARYALVPKQHKRTFVQTDIIQVVQRTGGRFLRGYDHEGARVSWDVVTDQDFIEEEVMRILRNLHSHKTTVDNSVQSIADDIVDKLNTLSNNLAQLGTTVERLGAGQKRSFSPVLSHHEPTTSWTLPKARKVRKMVNAMVKEAVACQNLLQVGRDVADGREDSSEFTLESSDSTTPESSSS